MATTASTVTVFGKGNMGSAIAGVFTDAGADVQVLDSHAGADTTVTGEIIVLAVPYQALSGIAGTFGAQFAGKTVVDITNPLDFTTFSLLPAADSSATAELAELLPEAHVLKAFNTNFAATLAAKTNGSEPTTVLVAGDDEAAKASFSATVTAGGLRVLDAGALSRARELEAVALMQMSLAASEQISWTSGFAVVK
ncbi:NADPH-dependent F420 reductase [Corynebacterium sp.]|jgi:predicted dinucleotide-binding enzyme|uniref:NADPH-dependent F420 reductase n=1 Tax=Corynebacterium sp. TaxID=1720 RepID=UPI0025BE2E48|nr:3-hydroxyacyl-CoA dehydrogenase NAD-binding domain-containing protein [Corynebacterium sp.]